MAMCFIGMTFTARSSATIDVSQSSPDVVSMQLSGTINTNGLTETEESLYYDPYVDASNAELVFDTMRSLCFVYTGFLTDPSPFGEGTYIVASQVSVDEFSTFMLNGSMPSIALSAHYSNESALNASMEFDSTISGMGLTPGTYEWTWGTGTNADSLTINIGAVPEPSTWWFLVIGTVLISLFVYRSRKAKRNEVFMVNRFDFLGETAQASSAESRSGLTGWNQGWGKKLLQNPFFIL